MFTSNSVFSFIDKMINIIKYNRKSALRKFLADWQLDKIDLRKIYRWITLIVIFIMSALFFFHSIFNWLYHQGSRCKYMVKCLFELCNISCFLQLIKFL